MSHSTYELIKQAILEKKQVVATYGGHVREMCPHVIGKKNGIEQALFFQFGGSSSSKGGITPENGEWRCMPIAGLTDIEMRDGEWHSGESHAKNQTCVDEIDVEVNY